MTPGGTCVCRPWARQGAGAPLASERWERPEEKKEKTTQTRRREMKKLTKRKRKSERRSPVQVGFAVERIRLHWGLLRPRKQRRQQRGKHQRLRWKETR